MLSNKSKSFLLTTCAGLLLGLAPAGITGEVHYRWTNERGYQVHSDRPPPKGVDYEVIQTGTGLKRIVDAQEGAVPAEIEPRVGNEFSQVDENEARRSKKNPELCKRAQTNLESLTGGEKVKVRDDKGEVRFLTEEEVIIEREKAKAQVSVYCK